MKNLVLFKTILFYFFIFFYFNLSHAQNNNCINYTGGLGDFEHYQQSELSNSLIKNENYIKRTTGWYFYNPPNRNYELRFYLDKNEKYSGNASQFISAIKNPGTASNPFFMYAIRYSNLSTETINYYPNRGDVIYGSFKVKFDNVNNLRFAFTIRLSDINIYIYNFVFPKRWNLANY